MYIMTHYYEKNIVEIKNEYTQFLLNILTPLIYEGIKKLYKKADEYEKQFEKAINDKTNINTENPGVFKIFQHFLLGIKNLNNCKIESEANRIKDASKCAEWFDNLVKSVIKSNIILLTYNASGKTCKIVEDRYHENIDINKFIHKCYIESARLFYDYPELMLSCHQNIDIKKNQRNAYELIRRAINDAIRQMLPMKLILEEYLSNDYVVTTEKKANMQNMVNEDITPVVDSKSCRLRLVRVNSVPTTMY